MATGILYLDVDDEITSVATRIRRSEPDRIAIVLPYGSRVATSRINLRLLSRDATTRGKRLSIVAADAATRALAASAGLPVFGTVSEYEESIAGIDSVEPAPAPAPPPVEPPPVEPPPVAMRPAQAAATSPTQRVVLPPARREAAGPAQPEEPHVATSIPVVGARRRPSLPRTGLLAIAGGLALVVLVTAVAAYTLLPSATIVVSPRLEPVGPIRFTVVADPEPAAGGSNAVRAERVSVEVERSATFEATGIRVEETKATGRVTFQSFNPAGANTIPSGSVVSTEGGIQFATVRSITLAKATIVPDGSGAVIIPTRASVDVEAVQPGLAGNVPANAITVVPRGEDPTLTKVRNADEATGGQREEFPQVTREDVDAAVASLRERSQEAFAERLADPAIVPGGMTLFADTALLEDPVFEPEPDSLVGQEVESFGLAAVAQGAVTAVDTAAIEALAAERLASSVTPGSRLVDGSTSISIGDGLPDGDRLTFTVVIEASEVQVPDAAELEALILGQPVEEAQATLSRFGEVTVDVWPDWVTSVPTIDARVDVEVRPVAEPDGEPGATPFP